LDITSVDKLMGSASGAFMLHALGDLDKAEDLFRQALRFTEQAGDVWMTSLTHVWLGTIRLVQDDPASATVEIGRGLKLARGQGDRLAIYVALYNLPQAAIAQEDHAGARVYLTEGIALSEQNHDLANLGYFLEALAIVESADNAPDLVPVLIGAAQTLRESTDNKTVGYCAPDESLLEQVEQRARQSLGERAYADALEAGRDLDVTEVVRSPSSESRAHQQSADLSTATSHHVLRTSAGAS
jgi:tetratricopeptide (TPR) repeat protein